MDTTTARRRPDTARLCGVGKESHSGRAVLAQSFAKRIGRNPQHSRRISGGKASGGQTMMRALAWTLIHFLWEGALISLVLAALLHAFQRSSARLRYGAACFAMLGMLGAFAVTFTWMQPAPVPVRHQLGPLPLLVAAPLAGSSAEIGR